MEDKLEQEFATYEQAVALKELGFDYDCFLYWYKSEPENLLLRRHDHILNNTKCVPAPLKQQVFRWFREKHEFYYHIFPLQITASDKTGYRYSWEIYNHTPEWIANDEELLGYLTYEEAEDACINKMIELTKTK